jgi:hypothetical protein
MSAFAMASIWASMMFVPWFAVWAWEGQRQAS